MVVFAFDSRAVLFICVLQTFLELSATISVKTSGAMEENRGSIVPEFAESVATELCVTDRVLDVLVAQVVLNRSRILSVVGELESG